MRRERTKIREEKCDGPAQDKSADKVGWEPKGFLDEDSPV